MRIGLLGGAFDPPHNGHLALARAVHAARGLDRIDLLVSGQSPHAHGKQNVTKPADRLAMAWLLASGEDWLAVEDFEVHRDGPSFTVLTLRELKRLHPDDEFSFILGGDMLANLPQWREIHEVLQLAKFIPVLRPGYGAEVFASLRNELGAEATSELESALVPMQQQDISSTRIRNAIAGGESIEGLVPPAIESYIRAHRLYSA